MLIVSQKNVFIMLEYDYNIHIYVFSKFFIIYYILSEYLFSNQLSNDEGFGIVSKENDNHQFIIIFCPLI